MKVQQLKLGLKLYVSSNTKLTLDEQREFLRRLLEKAYCELNYHDSIGTNKVKVIDTDMFVT